MVLTSTYYPVRLNGEVLDGEGEGEPLSGTFEAVLSPGARLTANTDLFYAYDSLRVNVDAEDAHRNLYIPVVSPSYEQLHVIAVSGDVKGAYRWEGTLLKTFTSSTVFNNNTTVSLQTDTGIRTPTI